MSFYFTNGEPDLYYEICIMLSSFQRGFKMKALILSGGTGTRLRPLTFTNAKQLLPLANIPILHHIIEKTVKAGISDIGIIVGDTHEQVAKSVGNGEKWNASVSYIYQPQPLGLAHAVKTAKEFIGEDDFLMILGDNAFSMNLDVLIENFRVSRANSSILLHRVENPSQYGVAVVENNCIKKLVEKPEIFISDLIITGVYIFDKTIFEAIDNTKPSKRGELEITDAIQVLLDMGGKVTYELIRGWWKDTGSLQDILEANRLILDEVQYRYCTGKNVLIENSTITGPVVIDDDSVITNSSIGPYVSIGKGVRINDCKVDNSIILDNTWLSGINKRISGSLIGKYVTVKSADKISHLNSFLLGDNCEIYL